MKQKAIYPKVFLDLFSQQGIIACWFLATLIVVQIIRIAISYLSNYDVGSYIMTTFIAANIFMLVMGIIVTHAFISRYVGNGVTRKDFFKGVSLGAIGLSIAIPIVTIIISLIEKGLVTLIKLPLQYETVFKPDVDNDTSFIGVIFSIIFTPNIDFSSHGVVVLTIFAISLLTFYLIGWLIGSAFYKHTLLGFVAIVMGNFILFVMSYIIGMLLGVPVPSSNDFVLPMPLVIILLIAVFGLSFYAIRLLTRKVVIKM